MARDALADADCAIAQALAIVGDWWSLLVVRDVAGGLYRFDELQAELEISRKVLSQRLASLVAHGVIEKRLYHERPRRYEYRLTAAGQGLIPVLIALQDWTTRFVNGDGSLTATATSRSLEARRVKNLVGSRIPQVQLRDSTGQELDPVSSGSWTVIYCYPGAYASASAYPAGWDQIPGTGGCTLESITYRDRLEAFDERDAAIVGVSTQRPDEQAAFARKQRIRFPLLSDEDLLLTGALRLPTFRAGGAERLKRLTLLVRHDREIRAVLYPISGPAESVDQILANIDGERGRAQKPA